MHRTNALVVGLTWWRIFGARVGERVGTVRNQFLASDVGQKLPE
jgi:hypothetical protein